MCCSGIKKMIKFVFRYKDNPMPVWALFKMINRDYRLSRQYNTESLEKLGDTSWGSITQLPKREDTMSKDLHMCDRCDMYPGTIKIKKGVNLWSLRLCVFMAPENPVVCDRCSTVIQAKNLQLEQYEIDCEKEKRVELEVEHQEALDYLGKIKKLGGL